jgi:hypothetical protein
MHRIIVYLAPSNNRPGVDLEVPAAIHSNHLAKLIAQLVWQEADDPQGAGQWQLFATPPGRLLRPDESLAEAGAWDGATITLSSFVAAYLLTASGRRYSCEKAELWIGRGSSQESDSAQKPDLIDLQLEALSNTVSRRHARLTLQGNQWFLTASAQARNPVLLNNQLLIAERGYQLHHADQIQLGRISLHFYLGACARKRVDNP